MILPNEGIKENETHAPLAIRQYSAMDLKRHAELDELVALFALEIAAKKNVALTRPNGDEYTYDATTEQLTVRTEPSTTFGNAHCIICSGPEMKTLRDFLKMVVLR